MGFETVMLQAAVESISLKWQCHWISVPHFEMKCAIVFPRIFSSVMMKDLEQWCAFWIFTGKQSDSECFIENSAFQCLTFLVLQSLVHECFCCFRIEFSFSACSGTQVNVVHSCCCLLSHLVPAADGKASLAHDFHSSPGSWTHDQSAFLRSRGVKAKFFHQQLFWNFVNAIKLLRHKLLSSVLNNVLSWTKWVPCRAPISSEITLRWAPFRAIWATGCGLTR